nr:hypothetical protein [Tanacetum cinerariifolium]
FWNTASVKRSGDVTRLQALVDKKKIVISEAVIREILQLNDAEGVNQVGDLSTHTTRFISPVLTQKVFANMRRVRKGFSGVETPLFEGMLENVTEDVAHDAIPSPLSHDIPSPSQEPSSPPQQQQKNDNAAHKLVIVKLKAKGRMIDDTDMNEGIELVKDVEVTKSEGRHAAQHTEKQAEIYNLDLDHSLKVLSMQEDDLEVQEVVEVVTTAKLITEVVTAVASQVSAASTTIPAASTIILAARPTIHVVAPTVVAAYTRRRKGVIIRDPEEELSLKTPAETQKYQGMKKRPQTESEACKNMMIYLKNTACYNMNFFKGMMYAQICPIFQARFDENIRFLFKSNEEMEEKDQEIIKSINETPTHKTAKRRKLSEEAQEAEDLRKRLEVVEDEDDDVIVEATPLASKVTVVDYQIVLIDNKPRFKIIRADETHQFYISFATLLKNFDREDLENLWRIVKDRFSTSKPTNFSDEYLLLTLKTMFEKPDGQDAIWRNQKSVHGLALVKRWKLLTLCGVHVITLSTVQLFLLVVHKTATPRISTRMMVEHILHEAKDQE